MFTKFISNKVKFFLFIPKIFYPLRFLSLNNSKIRPYFGINIYKTGGPYIRVRRLSKIFGNNFLNPNIIYAQSYWTSQELYDAIIFSEKYKIPIIFNQNGWFYRGWYGKNWKKKNNDLIKVHKKSKIVIYQSKFCKDTSIQLNSYHAKNNKILHNCVPIKITKFKKKEKNYFLLSGVFDQNSQHILQPALKAFLELSKHINYKRRNIKLIMAGFFTKNAKKSKWYNQINKKINDLIAKDLIEIRGKYSQNNIHKNFQDISYALHLKYKDPCPNAVIERMKLGIIHIFSKSGGTPELVGNSGLGIKVKEDWNNQIAVNHKDLLKNILKVIKLKKKLSINLKKKNKEFNFKDYVKIHRKIFIEILNNEKK